MGRGIPDHATAGGLDVMYVEAMDDDVLHKLDGNSGPIVDVHLVATPIDGPVRIHHQLLSKLDHHAPGKGEKKGMR